eukprot:TRINITY_DN82469_c0_g1_i1.p1 TRINITY_DN82469_c0_g1~~TRINITY_DN82469_c0_g1_i1.p1  ORF type:complete len:419 (+),score=80.90 TRINITY_DN82469_c0_g1_i1:67-1257(+)
MPFKTPSGFTRRSRSIAIDGEPASPLARAGSLALLQRRGGQPAAPSRSISLMGAPGRPQKAQQFMTRSSTDGQLQEMRPRVQLGGSRAALSAASPGMSPSSRKSVIGGPRIRVMDTLEAAAQRVSGLQHGDASEPASPKIALSPMKTSLPVESPHQRLERQIADRAAVLARRHKIDLHEIKQVLRAFEGWETASFDKAEFHTALCKVFHVSRINADVLHGAYSDSVLHGRCDMDKFLGWYFQNMFTNVAALHGDEKRSETNAMMYQLARKHSVPISTIDRVRSTFDKFDADRSGEIDFEEFQDMIRILLKATCMRDISEARLRKFWQEIDVDNNGMIDFDEFTTWYLKYFDTEDNSSGGAHGPIEALYNSYNPSYQRAKQLDHQEEMYRQLMMQMT